MGFNLLKIKKDRLMTQIQTSSSVRFWQTILQPSNVPKSIFFFFTCVVCMYKFLHLYRAQQEQKSQIMKMGKPGENYLLLKSKTDSFLHVCT